MAKTNDRWKLIEPKAGMIKYNGDKIFNGEIRLEDGKMIIINYGESNLTIDDIEIRRV